MADEITLEPGYAFRPSDDDLITLFLRPKIAKMPLEERIINDADVYSADPAELVARHRSAPGTQGNSCVCYFFCSPRYTSKRASSGGRRQRAIGGDERVWKSEGSKKAVNGVDDRRVGYLQKFSYGVYGYESSRSTRTFTRLGWCMTEYVLDDAAADGAEKTVLCKVYRSPRAAAPKAADLPCSGTKRKADDGVDRPEEAPPSGRPRQEAGSEHEQPQLPPDFDLEALLSAPMDENLITQFSTTTTEQCLRYLSHDEPLPLAPTMEVFDGGSGDDFIQTANGPCTQNEIMALLAAGQTVDDILGTAPAQQVFG